MAGCNKTTEQTRTPVEKGELTLYNQQRTSAAYIDYDDDETIYLWEGEPVAYLVPYEGKDADGVKDIYGFNGEFLGWYCDGVM